MFGAVDARDPWVPVAPITRRHVSGLVVGGVGMADEGTLEALHKRFTEMDADGSGSLTKDDIVFIMKEKEEAAVEVGPDGAFDIGP